MDLLISTVHPLNIATTPLTQSAQTVVVATVWKQVSQPNQLIGLSRRSIMVPKMHCPVATPADRALTGRSRLLAGEYTPSSRSSTVQSFLPGHAYFLIAVR